LIAGIDYSISSPSICIHKNGIFNPSNCTFSFFALDKWRNGWSTLENVNCSKLPKNLEGIKKYIYLSDWVLDNLIWWNGRVQTVFLEDYAYAATGRVFHIAENAGILKYKLKNFKTQTIPPTVIKKFATGKGNASKEDMLDAWKNEDGTFELIQETGNPASDIIDSYFICKYGYYESNKHL